MIAEQVTRMGHLVDDFIDAEQIQSDRFRLNYENTKLPVLIDEVVRLWRTVSKGHPILLAQPKIIPLVRCDPNRIQQALNNLLSNAIKYSPSGGAIQVVVGIKNDFVSISITDKGLGIPREDMENIFQPFRRGSSVRDFIPGSGLGLSSTKKIVEAHGGRIEIETQVGLGSTFRLWIPIYGNVKKAA